MSKTILEMRAKTELQDKTMAEIAQRHGAIEIAIKQIGEQIERQHTFNEGVRASFTSLSEEVGKHQDNFREVARIFQAHEEHIVKTGAATQEMAQYINALIKENENKTVWISSLMRESQEQTHILRPHQLGLKVQAEVIKTVVNQQQQQTTTGTGSIVSEAGDDQDSDCLDFLGGRNPNTGPPIIARRKKVDQTPQGSEKQGKPQKELRQRTECDDENKMDGSRTDEGTFKKMLAEKMMTLTNVDVLDDETIKNIERMVVLRTSTKHINLWMRQLEMKRREMCELAEMLEFADIKRD